MKSSSISRIFTIIALILGLIGLIMVFRVAGQDQTVLEGDPELQDSVVAPIVMYGMWLVIIGGILGVFSSIFGLIINPKGLKNALIGIIAIVAIVGIAYGISSGADYEMYNTATTTDPIDERTSRLVSTGLNTFYIIGFLSILSVIYSAIARIFK
ncbi:MAG: hypothetical protein LPK80_11050 [Bacteroidota bacterium]|nr:hypothetical protein [Bacteroidota bacterium]